jgi:hypothetical protein
MGNRLGNLRQWSLPAREAVLALGMLLLYLLVAPVAYALNGPAGLLAAAAAGGVCLLASALALAASGAFRQPLLAPYGMLVAMAVRTGIPLIFALAVRLHANVTFERSLICYLMVFYLAALGIEIPLSLPHAGQIGPRT